MILDRAKQQEQFETYPQYKIDSGDFEFIIKKMNITHPELTEYCNKSKSFFHNRIRNKNIGLGDVQKLKSFVVAKFGNLNLWWDALTSLQNAYDKKFGRTIEIENEFKKINSKTSKKSVRSNNKPKKDSKNIDNIDFNGLKDLDKDFGAKSIKDMDKEIKND